MDTETADAETADPGTPGSGPPAAGAARLEALRGSLGRAADALAGAVGPPLGPVFDVVGYLRRGRPLHPEGVVLPGRLHRDGASGQPRSGATWIDTPGDEDVLVRLSRGGGLPAALPDVHGLAVRGDGYDLLLSTGGRAPVARHVPAPRRTPSGALYGSLMPFRSPGGPLLVAAEPSPRRALPGDVHELGAELAREPLRLWLVWSRLRGPWRPFGWLEIGGAPAAGDRPVGAGDGPIRFDPLDPPPGTGTYRWTRLLRAPAYAAARRHPAGAPSAAGPST